MPLFYLLSSLFTALISTVGNVTKSILPFVFKTLMSYKSIFVYGFIFVFIIHFVTPVLSFGLYTLNVGITNGLSPWVTETTVSIIIYTLLAVLFSLVSRILYSLLNK